MKSSPSSPNNNPNEKPETLTLPTEISDNASDSAISILGCSTNAADWPPNSVAIKAESIVIIAKPADAVVSSSLYVLDKRALANARNSGGIWLDASLYNCLN